MARFLVAALAFILGTAAIPRRCAAEPRLYSERGRYGFKDSGGTLLVPPNYLAAKPFVDGLAPVKRVKWGFIDQSGAVKIDMKYLAAEPFSEGLAAVEDASSMNYGFVDKSGKVVIDYQGDASRGTFSRAKSFSEGLSAVQIKGRWGYIDKNGVVAVAPSYADCGKFQEGVAPVEVASLRAWGFIDRTGATVIAPQFDFAGSFASGLAVVRSHGKFGYIHKDGTLALPAKYDGARDFSEGLAPVLQGQGWSYIRPDGTVAIRGPFADALPFAGGLAVVTDASFGKQYYMNAAGDWTMRRSDGAGNLVGGLEHVLVSFDSSPPGAEVYFVPKWELDTAKPEELLSDDSFMMRCRSGEDTPGKAELWNQVYMVIFRYKEKSETRELNVHPGGDNELKVTF